MANALLDGQGRNFWTEIKQIRGNHLRSSNIIAGLTDSREIAALFANKYRELYTSVPYDRKQMHDLLSSVNASLHENVMPTDCVFNPHEIKSAMSSLKHGKTDGAGRFTSDHLINSGDDFLTHLSCPYPAISIHGVVTSNFLTSTVLPIPKDRKNATDSSNYRGIALSSLYGKLLIV